MTVERTDSQLTDDAKLRVTENKLNIII